MTPEKRLIVVQEPDGAAFTTFEAEAPPSRSAGLLAPVEAQASRVGEEAGMVLTSR